MTDRRSSDVMGGLPHSRPHRRSDKRGSRPTGGNAASGDGDGLQTPAPQGPKADQPSTGRKQGVSSPKAASTPKNASTPKGASPPKGPSTPRPRPVRKAPSRSTRSRIGQPAQPGGTPKASRPPRPESPERRPAQPDRTERSERPDILGTAVQAAAELAEIGLMVGARALRSAMSRLPRP